MGSGGALGQGGGGEEGGGYGAGDGVEELGLAVGDAEGDGCL